MVIITLNTSEYIKKIMNMALFEVQGAQKHEGCQEEEE